MTNKKLYIIGNGFDLFQLADDIDRISHLLENPPVEFGIIRAFHD